MKNEQQFPSFQFGEGDWEEEKETTSTQEEESNTEETDNPPAEETENDQTNDQESDEGNDDIASALRSQLIEWGFPLEEKEDFTGTVEDVQEELWNRLPEMFLSAVSPNLRKIIEYGLTKEDATEQELLQFLNTSTVSVPDFEGDDAESNARSYLFNRLKASGKYDEDAEIDDYLDTLEEKGRLIKDAKAEFKLEEKENSSKREELQRKAQEEKANREKQERQFVQQLDSTLKELPWKEEKKNKVKAMLNQKTFDQINGLVYSSPKALIQLADFYSKFDDKKGEFDLSDFEVKTKSKEAVANKNKLQILAQGSGRGKVQDGNSTDRDPRFGI